MNISNPVKIMLTIVIIALIGAVFYFTTYQVQMKELVTLEADLNAKNARLIDVQNQVKDLPNLIAKRDRLKAENEVLLKDKLGPEETKDFVPNYLSQIENLIKEIRAKTGDESFDITELRPGASAVEAASAAQKTEGAPPKKTEDQVAAEAVFSGFPTRTFDMTMKGRYNTLIEFLTQLGELKMKRLVTINRIGLSPGGTGENSKNLSPILNITIPVTAYLRQGGAQQ